MKTLFILLFALVLSTAAAKIVGEAQASMVKQPELSTPAIKQGFEAKKIVIGMDPYVAHLAGGPFTFKVDADPAKWPRAADPVKVMWAQAKQADASKIWMTFENDTQFPKEGQVRFSVFVENGKVQSIDKLDGASLN